MLRGPDSSYNLYARDFSNSPSEVYLKVLESLKSPFEVAIVNLLFMFDILSIHHLFSLANFYHIVNSLLWHL